MRTNGLKILDASVNSLLTRKTINCISDTKGTWTPATPVTASPPSCRGRPPQPSPSLLKLLLGVGEVPPVAPLSRELGAFHLGSCQSSGPWTKDIRSYGPNQYLLFTIFTKNSEIIWSPWSTNAPWGSRNTNRVENWKCYGQTLRLHKISQEIICLCVDDHIRVCLYLWTYNYLHWTYCSAVLTATQNCFWEKGWVLQDDNRFRHRASLRWQQEVWSWRVANIPRRIFSRVAPASRRGHW